MTIAPKFPPTQMGGGGFEIDLRALFFHLRERSWIILLAVLLGVSAGVWYLAWAPKIYAASATVEVERAAPNVLDVRAVDATTLDSIEAVKTIEGKLNTSALMRRLVRDPELAVTPAKLGLPEGTRSPEAMAAQLRELISVGLVRGTRLIAITASDTDPEFAATLANGVVSNYVRQLEDERAEVARQANSHLHAEAERLKSRLAESERALQAYREDQQSASLEETQNIVVAQLQEMNAKLTEARAERMKLQSAVEQAHAWREKAPDQLLSVAAVASAPGVVELQKRLAEMHTDRANLSERYLDAHPRLIQLKSQIEQGRTELGGAVQRAVEGVDVAFQIAQKTEASYGVALAEQEQKALALNKTAIGYKVLERNVEADRAMFVAVVKRLQETDVTKGLAQGILRPIDSAVTPERPTKPRPKLILAAAGVAGLLTGTLLALLLHALDPTLKTVDQAERTLGIAVLAAIPRSRRSDRDRALVGADEGLLAEAFRTLRTSLSCRDDSPRTILFTSATENDGKTFCALNYAAALARAGLRTLLVDADLRKPSLGAALLPDDAGPGLAEVLQARTPLADSVRQSEVPNLFLLPAGAIIYNPAELLHGRVFPEFIATVEQQYDYVIVDSAPLQAVSDTFSIVKAMKGVCFVLRADATHRRAAAKSCQSLLEAGAPLLGLILNRVPDESRGYYYHYQSGAYGQDVYGEAVKRAALLKAGPRA